MRKALTWRTSRRSLLGAIAAAPFAEAATATSRQASPHSSVSITIDDFDLANAYLLDGEERDSEIRAVLRRHGVRAAGFVAGKYVADERAKRVLQAWASEGHLLGNHSFSHSRFTGEHPDEFISDVLQCEKILASYSTFQKLFRFPYLAEGQTAAGRDTMNDLLKKHGYRNGHVTIDTSDWFIDMRLRQRLQANPAENVERFRQYYLSHIWDRSSYYEGLAYRVLRRPIRHTLLLHHRTTTALFLDDTLRMFKSRGWRVEDPEQAFHSPEFALTPRTLPSGQSLVWALAKESGKFDQELRYPGEDSIYEEPKMVRLGL